MTTNCPSYANSHGAERAFPLLLDVPAGASTTCPRAE
jgi:hypothetical protein